VIEVVVGAMILMGGPVAWATQSPTVETHVSSISTSEALIDPCTGPIGSSTAPLGDCVGTITEADVVAVQTELWTKIFGTNQDPNLSYNMVEGTVFTGRGDFQGVNAYGVPFNVHVYHSVQAFSTAAEGSKLKGWHVFASVLGPTGIAVPVFGLMIDLKPINAIPSQTTAKIGGVGFVMAGIMSAAMHKDCKIIEIATNNNFVGVTPAQSACAAACGRTLAGQLAQAIAALGVVLLAASAALTMRLSVCAGTAVVFPPLGTLLGTGCALTALALYAGTVAGAMGVFAAAQAAANATYINCMAGCGITIVVP